MSMLDLAKLTDSSESEDDDYVPSAGESEDASDADNSVGSDDEESAVKKRKKPKKEPVPRKRKRGIRLDEEDDPVCKSVGSGVEDDEKETPAALTEEEEKKRADQLWSDFMQDVEPVPKKRTAPATSAVSVPSTSSTSTACPQAAARAEKKVKITQLLEFAGETFKVEKEVAASSKEAQLFEKAQGDVPGQSPPVLPGKKKPGGVENMLNQLFNKKQKITVMEKTKLDWDSYKQSEGIAEDLQNHNRGKDGYLEKQAFLHRTDVRQFEIEKTIRTKSRSTNQP